jgi:tetratricopeptide (TPR) repeat protein
MMRAATMCFVAVAALAGCRSSAPVEIDEAGAVPPAPRIELGGCAGLTRGPVCEVTEAARGLRLWVTPDDATLRVSWGERALSAQGTPVDGGRLFTVEIPAGESAGTLEAVAEKGAARTTFRLPVRAPEVDARIAAARALQRAGKLREALEQMPAPESVPASLRGRALGQRARLDLASGQVEAAVRGFRASMEAHRRDGRVSDELLDGMALVYALLGGHRHAEARAVLGELAPTLAASDEGRAQIGYYRALVDCDGGDLRAALRALEEAERGAGRLGLADIRRSARQVRARLLHALGRPDEARTILRAEIAATPAERDPCAHGELVGDLGWIGLLEREAAELGAPAAGDAELGALLEETRVAFAERCPRVSEGQNAQVNLALFAVQQGDLEGAQAAEQQLGKARGAAPSAEIAGWMLDVEGRIGLIRGRGAEALRRYDDLTARARAAHAPELLWRGLVGRAQALALLARDADAIASYREAERVLDRQVLAVPLAGGRAGFLGHHGQSAALLAELLVRQKRPAEAASVVRLARARALASQVRLERVGSLGPEARLRWDDALARYERERDALDEESRDDWGLASVKVGAARAARRAGQQRADTALDDAFAALADRPRVAEDLVQPREGELFLVYQALPGAGLRGFAVDLSGTETHPLSLPAGGASAEQQSQALLEPFAAAIARARRVKIFATGPLLRVDLHALPFQGEPLLAGRAVVYPLDLPGAPPAARAQGARPTALVVADPRNNLGRARREAELVAERLAPRWAVQTLLGDAAQKGAVLEALAVAELFHFGGHGVFAGATGWESTLSLADEGALSLGDVLTLPHVPTHVVLSACETGRSPGAARVADISLAGAFLLAGTEAVVAAARPVADDLAVAIAAALYQDIARPGWDPAVAVAQAQLGVRSALPGSDWASYRLITR